ncbi:MAG TPA: hypothetical protein VIY27_08330 [Myxococcota bacterium]
MTKQASVNGLPATGSIAMYDLMEFLRASLGFTITISGDGIAAFDNTGTDVFTNGGVAGANGMGNNNAHFTAQDPAGGYEWCFQRSTTDINWEIVVSALDGFTGGNATTRPTATDEQVIHNASILPANATYRWHLVGFDAAETGVYPWFAYATLTGTGIPNTLIAHESLDPASFPALVGTRAAPTTGEPDPSIYVAGLSASSSTFLVTTAAGAWLGTTPPCDGWYCMNGTNSQTEAFVNMFGSTYAGSPSFADDYAPADSASNDGIGPDPRDGSDPMLPMLVGRVARLAAQVGHKGLTAHMRLKGTDREYPDTLDLGSERFVYAGDFLLPFANATTPLN